MMNIPLKPVTVLLLLSRSRVYTAHLFFCFFLPVFFQVFKADHDQDEDDNKAGTSNQVKLVLLVFYE